MSYPNLRDVDDLMLTAVRVSVGALNPPAEDRAVVVLAEQLASAIDGMAPVVRDAMIAQVSGQLMRVLKELDERARRRRAGSQGGRPNRVAQLRSAHAQATAKRTRG